MTTRRKTATERTCARCGRTFPLTEEFWYFYKSGSRRGGVTGYCRPCQNAACRAYEPSLSGLELARRRVQQRESRRRIMGYNPERYRVTIYDLLLAGQTADEVADQAIERAAS